MSAAWELGPFTRHPGAVLAPDPSLEFSCPVRGEAVRWAAKDVFNPGAVWFDGRVHLLVRAEDRARRGHGTSRIGLAVSDDGFRFALEPEPVLFPDEDPWQPWEWPGGCEDPRLVEDPEGGFVCLYSAFDGRAATLMVATSHDLRTWHKHGPAFAGTPHARRWSKSGSIVTEVRGGRLVASRLDGRYWMYWGEGTCFAATSQDLRHWTPVEFDATADRYLSQSPADPADPAALPGLPGDDGRDADRADASWEVHRVAGARVLRPLLFPRRGRFDSLLVEPGPPAVRTEDGVVLVYNGANHPTRGDPTLAPLGYQPGQVLFDERDPASCVARSAQPFLRPDTAAERVGQVDHVCFAQGLVAVGDRWHLYVGMADSQIGCATAPRS